MWNIMDNVLVYENQMRGPGGPYLFWRENALLSESNYGDKGDCSLCIYVQLQFMEDREKSFGEKSCDFDSFYPYFGF